MTLPKQHKTAVVVRNEDGPTSFAIEHAPLPQPGPHDLLVQLSVSGVCGTDFGLASGKLGPHRRILGHEGVGRVVKLGDRISEDQVKIGQRVGVAWMRDVCGSCAMCMTDGGETRCSAQLNSGRKIDGTFAEYTIVPYRYITTLPEGPKDEILAPILCGGVTIYKGLKICGATPGQFIVISGAGGGVGALGVQYAKAMGFRTIALDAGKDKEKYCLDLGAEKYIDVLTTEDVAAVVKEKTGGGAAAVLVAAGSGKAYNAAPNMLGPFGTLVCIGITPPDQVLSIHPLLVIDMGIKVIGSAVGTRKDIREAIEFVERGLVKPTVHLGKLEDLPDIGEKMMQGKVIGKYVIRLGEDSPQASQP